ncbi:alpha/beta hydrolase-fold protein [Bacteroidota bacterium]
MITRRIFSPACLIAVCFITATHAQLMRGREIHEDRTVTFRIKAPDAKEVKVINKSDEAALGAAEYTLVKGVDGIWSVTTNPCRPGFHYYFISIDGYEFSDPESQAYFGWGRWSSGLEIPDDNLDFYSQKDVPHGEVRYHWYQSETTGKLRKCLIYTPPGYDNDVEKRYPVLFLQHGAGESELGWTMQGKVNIILDNLIAEKKAAPMIIVMDNGYAAAPGSENSHRPRGEDNRFTDLVLNELVPMIDENYRTITDRENRAIAGLSMGSGQAMRIGMTNTDMFASVGAFSGGMRRVDINTSFNGVFKDPEKFNKEMNLFWFGCGELDRGFESASAAHKVFEKAGINHVWYPGPGSHEWQVWRHHVYEFAQLLFK